MGLCSAPIVATFPQAPLRSRTVGFPQPGSDLGFPSSAFPDGDEAQVPTYVHPAPTGLPMISSPHFQQPDLGTESEDHLGTAKYPEPLCYTPALPSCRRHPVSPHRKLLPLHRSYGLMRQTAALLPPLASPAAAGLCRLPSAPAAQRSFPTLSLPILPRVSGPLLRRLLGCTCPLLPLGHWPSPHKDRVGASLSTDNHFCRTFHFEAAVIR